jgi:hypothetical protein
MRITATHIAQWANKVEARGLLPLFVRRLISATSEITALSMPGGDSVGSPGFDGVIQASVGNAWVSTGVSYWEMGCGADVIAKARSDFKTRCKSSPRDAAINSTFVFVTPRRWPAKQKWITEARRENHWSDIRAYDADDLEVWLEAAPGVSLWFGELLGLSGSGVSSIGRYWDTWRTQSKPTLTTQALLLKRESAISAFHKAVSSSQPLIVIEGDSREEAIAFACAQLLETGQADQAACVSSADGWRFVDTNAQLRIAIATSDVAAESRSAKQGCSLVVPIGLGDRLAYSADRADDEANDSIISLSRLSTQDFEAALVELGVEKSDSSRLAATTGRSWSVYRRVRATNPAIRKPVWLNDPAARCLVTVMLVGCWNGNKAGDRECLEAIFKGSYDDLEVQLKHMAAVDDSPVLQIGSVWKAKAPLDLLYLFASKITSGELQAFFDLAEAVLSKPDPSLELETEERWAAAIYGKVRGESGLVIDSIVDSVVKLRVYAENQSDDTNSDLILLLTDNLLRNLLHDADEQRWLSLSSVLRELAEASPSVFINLLELSLNRDDAPVLSLLNETKSSGSLGRAWHTDLLWALEVLAWYPARLPRVADILARLAATPIKGNWGNTPQNTLISLFRPWWPQTTATAVQRIAAIDLLIRTRAPAAWNLLTSLVGHIGFASANASPRWRDDDAGARSPNDATDLGWYWSEIGARLLKHAEGHPEKIADLAENIERFDGEYRVRLAELIEGAGEFDDDGRELIRASIKKHLNWHNSFNRDGTNGNREMADRLRPAFDALAARDIVKRHMWLFRNHWVELPDGREDDYQSADISRLQLRVDAINQIFDGRGWDGLLELGALAQDSWLVGRIITTCRAADTHFLPWVIERLVDCAGSSGSLLVGGALREMRDEARVVFLGRALSEYSDRVAAGGGIAKLLTIAPCDRCTWELVELQGAEVQKSYWMTVHPGYLSIDATEDRSYLVARLMEVGRCRTAFNVADDDLSNIEIALLVRILEGIRHGGEPGGKLPASWNIGKALSRLERSGEVSHSDLAMLEFAFFNALQHTEHGVRTLYKELLSKPDFFIELACLAYKAKSELPEPIDEAFKPAATIAWRVLHDGRGIPGLLQDKAIDSVKFNDWVEVVRQSAVERERIDVVDCVIGQWFSNCPADEDGIWPCLAVRDLLDRIDADNIRSGFQTGVMNNRGITSRAYDAGGSQERLLREKYRDFAKPLTATHPRVATMLEQLANSYDSHARMEDRSARLRVEGHRRELI